MERGWQKLFVLLTFLGLIISLALSSGFSSPLTVEEEYYYALKVGGKITGYSTYKVVEKKTTRKSLYGYVKRERFLNLL